MTRILHRDEARQARDLLLLALGLLGLLAGVVLAWSLRPGEPPAQQTVGWTLTFAAAVSVTLLADIVRHLLQRRALAPLLLKLALFAINAMLLAAEFLIFLFAAAAVH